MSIDVDESWDSGDRHGFLLQLFDVLHPISDPVEIQHETCRMLTEWLDVDRGYCLEIDEDSGLPRAHMVYARNNSGLLPNEHTMPDFEWSGDRLRHGECHVIPDTRTSAQISEPDCAAAATRGVLACMIAPVIRDEKLLGALCVATSSPRKWEKHEAKLLRDVAQRSWAAMERAQTELALRESEARFQALFDSLGQGVCVFERLPIRPDGLRDYRYTSANRAIQQMFGISDLVGRSVRDTFPSEVEDWYDDCDQVLETGEAIQFERELAARGIVLETNIARVEDGSDRRLVAVVQDVTRRRDTEEALQESEERQAFLLKLSDDLRSFSDPVEIQSVAMRRLGEYLNVMRAGYYEFEADQDTFSVITKWQEPGALQLPDGRSLKDFGQEIQEGYLAGQTLFARDTEREARTEANRAAFRAVEVRAWIGIPLVKDGRLLTAVGVHSRAPRDWTSDEIHVVEDVAERTWAAVERAHAEAALQESERQFRALVNATTDVVYRMSSDWRVLWPLDGRGFVQDSLEPSTDWLEKYIIPEERQQVMAAVRKAIETKSPFQMEHRARRPDGTLGWTFSRAIPLINDAGEIVEWFGAATDITERRKAVEALAHSQRVEAIGRLAGAIAHDFNNLLTVVIANIELAEIRSNDAAIESFLEKAMTAAQLGEKLNQRLLSWAGQSPMQPQTLNLNGLVKEMSPILDRSTGERVRVTLEVGNDLWPIFIDPAHIESAILNLVVNAYDAMPNGGEIWLTTSNATIGAEEALGAPKAKPGDYVCVCITDNGMGMTEEVQRRALEPFFSTKERGTGVGLGLFSVETMVHQASGFLEFESQPGHGTTFRLYFPRARSKGAGYTAPADTAEVQPLAQSKMLILMVEDQEAVREATRDRLEALGYNVIAAENADDALAELNANGDIRLVFTDVVMPGSLSGRDLAKRIMSDHPDIAVLLTSGYTAGTAPVDDEDPTATVPVLAKPYRLNDLAQALNRVLGPGGNKTNPAG